MCCVFMHAQLSQDEATTFYDELNHHIFELVSSSDVNEKKGGILAIGKSPFKYEYRLKTIHRLPFKFYTVIFTT